MRKLLIADCALLFILSPGALQAQVGLGGQLSWAEDFDLGIGARATFGLPTTIPLEIIGSVDYFFPESVPGASVTYWEANANIVYMFQIPASPIAPYAGGGLNLAYGSVDLGIPGVDASSTQVGLNILGGAKFNLGPVTPFGEMRFELNGGEQFVISAGALFSVGPGL